MSAHRKPLSTWAAESRKALAAFVAPLVLGVALVLVATQALPTVPVLLGLLGQSVITGLAAYGIRNDAEAPNLPGPGEPLGRG